MVSNQTKLLALSLSVIFSLVLILDMIIGFDTSNEVITHFKVQDGGRYPVFGIYTDKGEYPSTKNMIGMVSTGDSIQIFRTRILGELTQVRISEKTVRNETYSIYNNLRFFPLVCILSTILALIFRTRNEGTYDTFLIISTLVLIYLTISIFSNNSI